MMFERSSKFLVYAQLKPDGMKTLASRLVYLLIVDEPTSAGKNISRTEQILNLGLPHREQGASNQHQRQTQPQPHAHRAHLHPETQECAQWQTYHPVANEIRQHGNTRVARASQRSRSHNL